MIGSGGGSGTYSVGGEPEDDFSDSGTVKGRFSFSSQAHYGESAVVDRVDDEFSILGTASLGYSGSATQQATVVGHSTRTSGEVTVEADYQVRTGGKATASGGGQFVFTITHAGTQAGGSYHGTQLVASSRASQVAGTVDDGEETTPFRDNEAGTHSLDLTDRGTFSTASGEFAGESGHENSRKGQATLVEIFTNRASSYAGSLAFVDEEIIITAGGSGSLEKGTYKRTITEKFSYAEEDGQFAREGTVSDVTERTADRLEQTVGEISEGGATGSASARRDGGFVSTDSFRGTFREDASGRIASGAATGTEERFGGSKTTYTRQEGENHESSTSQSKSHSDGTSRGAVEIGPDGTSLGPIHFSGSDLSRVQNRGDLFTIDATSDSAGGVTTKTITVEGGNGHLRGEVSGHSSGTLHTSPSPSAGEGLGEGSSTANIAANTDGDTGGHGFFMFTTVKTDTTAGTKDTELVVSRGNDNAKSDGRSSGEIRTGRDAIIDLTVGGHGEGDGKQTTTRVLTSTDKAAGTSSRTSVTRSDTGEGKTNTDGTVKTEDGQTERTGTFDGNSDNIATVIYDYRASSALSGQPKSYEKANGTITTDVNTTFNGNSKSTNTDTFETLHADAIRKSTEDSTYESGWSDGSAWSFLLGSGEWSGEKLTQTVKGHGSEKIQSDVESGELIVTDDPNGTVGYTDTLTIVSWNYDVDDADNYSKFDRTFVSTLTNKTGKNDEGNRQHTSSQTVTDTTDAFAQVTTASDVTGKPDQVIANKSHRTITDSQTVTTTPNAEGAQETIEIVNTVQGEDKYTLKDSNTDYVYYAFDPEYNVGADQWSGTVTTTINHRSTYKSSHQKGADGLATGGSFSVVSPENTTITVGKFGRDREYEFFGFDVTDDQDQQFTITEFSSTTENGNYDDRRGADGQIERLQQGQWETVYRTTQEGHSTRIADHDGGEEGYVFTDDDYTSRLTREETTTGKYDPQGSERKKLTSLDFESHDDFYEYREFFGNEYPQDNYWWWTHDRDDVVLHYPAEGAPTGIVDTGFWSENYSELEEPHLYRTPWGYLPVNEYFEYDPDPTDPFADPPPQPKVQPTKLPPPPTDSVIDAFFGGLEYGAVELLNSYTKTFTLGYADFEALAEDVAARNYIGDDIRDQTRGWADLSSNAALGAIGPGAARAVGKIPGVSRLAGTSLGRGIGAAATSRPAQLGLLGLNGINGAKNGLAAAEAFAQGNLAQGLQHTIYALENAVGVRHNVKGFARPVTGAPKPIKGGRYEDVRAANIGGDVHHIPADSVSQIPRNRGPSIHMDTPDHAQTASFGNSRAARAFRQQQKELIDQGRFRDAMQMDIDDVRRLFGGKYDDAIQQMLDAFGYF